MSMNRCSERGSGIALRGLQFSLDGAYSITDSLMQLLVMIDGLSRLFRTGM